jgi:S-adenosylhomocysteine hydrolase
LSGNFYGTTTSSQLVQFAHPAPDLPVLNQLTLNAKEFLSQVTLKPEETAIIGAQHILETTATLLGKFRELGFEIYITGKCYSTCPSVLKTMENLGIHVWPGSKPKKLGEYQAACEKDIMTVLNAVEQNRKIKNIIVLDDGGRFYEKIPPHFYMRYLIGGVEQTRAGFYSHNVAALPNIPIVNVAQSAAKVMFESPFIANAAVEQIVKVTGQLQNKISYVMGIIGFGAIGRALADRLLQDGFSVCIFDKDPAAYKNYANLKKVKIMPSIEHLFTYTKFIIGCTGQDSTASFEALNLNGFDRILVSVSSEDKEFKKLLKGIASKTILEADPLATIRCHTTHGNRLEILYGGFPINFSESAVKPFNVPSHLIAFTQGLLFSAVMQTLGLIEKAKDSDVAFIPASVMLDPELQQYTLDNWYRTTKQDELPRDLIAKFIADKTFVVANSKGLYEEGEGRCKYALTCVPSKKLTAKL